MCQYHSIRSIADRLFCSYSEHQAIECFCDGRDWPTTFEQYNQIQQRELSTRKIQLSSIRKPNDEIMYDALIQNRFRRIAHGIEEGECLAYLFSPPFVYDYMLLDALYWALSEYISLQYPKTVGLTEKQSLAVYIKQLTGRPFTIKHANQPPAVNCIETMINCRKDDTMQSEMDCIDRLLFYPIVSCKSLLASIDKQKGTNTALIQVPYQVFSNLFQIYLMNRVFLIIPLLYADVSKYYDSKQNCILSASFFSRTHDTDFYDVYVFPIIRRWKKVIFKFLARNQISIDSIFWRELACSFSRSIQQSLEMAIYMLESIYISLWENELWKVSNYKDLLKMKQDIIGKEESKTKILERNPFIEFELAIIKFLKQKKEKIVYNENRCPLMFFSGLIPIKELEKNLQAEYDKQEKGNVCQNEPRQKQSSALASYLNDLDLEQAEMNFDEQMPLVLSDFYEIIPCCLENSKNSSNVYVKICSDAIDGCKLSKIRSKSIEQWKMFFHNYCRYKRNSGIDDCMSESLANKCKEDFLQSIIKIKSMGNSNNSRKQVERWNRQLTFREKRYRHKIHFYPHYETHYIGSNIIFIPK